MRRTDARHLLLHALWDETPQVAADLKIKGGSSCEIFLVPAKARRRAGQRQVLEWTHDRFACVHLFFRRRFMLFQGRLSEFPYPLASDLSS
jgi:hypothetical protein